MEQFDEIEPTSVRCRNPRWPRRRPCL